MADKILPAAQQYLNDTKVINQAYLVAIELPGQTGSFLTLTTYGRDIEYLGVPYQTGTLKKVTNVTRTATLTSNAVSVVLSGVPQAEIDRALSSSSYLERVIRIYKVVIKEDGSLLEFYDDGSTFLLFEGKITDVSVKESGANTAKGSSEVTWKCAGAFYELDRVNGRITDDESHRGLITDSNGDLIPSNGAKKLEYQQDKGFFHSNQSIDILASYQTEEKRYKVETSKSWGGLKTDVDMIEYYETVTREVDIRFNLAAKYIPVVYGVQKVQGLPVFADIIADNPDRIYVVYAFCEGEIEGFLDFYIDDNPIICYDSIDQSDRVCFGSRRDSGSTIGTTAIEGGEGPNGTTVHGERYNYDDGNGEIKFWVYHGKNDQTASPIMVALAAANRFLGQTGAYGPSYGPEYWDSDFKLLDTAYVVVEFNITDERTDVPTIHADIRGKKVSIYDEDGLVSTDETSLNPAWQKLDYIRSPIYGVGIPFDRIDLDSFIETADLFNVLDTTYEPDWVPFWRYVGWNEQWQQFQHVMQTNTMLDTANTLFKNTETMLNQSICALNIVNGKYTLTAEAESQEVINIPESDIVNGNIQISDITSKNKYNTVVASITDPGLGWANNTITFFDGEYLAEDENVERKLNLAFPYITNYYTARALCERELRKSRFNREVKITLPFKYVDLPINRPVTLTKERFGWDNKEFLLRNVTFMPNGNTEVTLREYSEGVFINSPKSDNSDNQNPKPENLVKPPRNFRYLPSVQDSDEGTIGKNGELRWEPSLTNDVTYYSIRITGQVDPVTVAVDSIDKALGYLFAELYGYAQGQYTFECRAVAGARGRSSSPAVIVVDVDPSKNLPKVTNLRITNTANNSNYVWLGPDPILAWDPLPDDYLPVGTESYLIDILDPDTDDIISQYQTTGLTMNYPFSENKTQYFNLKGEVGVFRSLDIRIKAAGQTGELSVDWTYL
ncbi:central tail fiber J [Vibrio phage D239]